MNLRTTPIPILCGLGRLPAVLAVCALLVQCSDGRVQTGRDWVNSGQSRKLNLVGDGGVLYVDKSYLRPLQKNYSYFLSVVTAVYKERRYFNRAPVPVAVYLMPDRPTLEQYCRQPLNGRGAFVAAEDAIYVHADGKPLVDGGIRRALVDGLARAVCKEIYYGKGPAWLIEGSARLHADGGFGLPKDKKLTSAKDFVWFQGVPDAEFFRPLLDPDKKLPSFETIRKASPEEFARLGNDGALVATVACYLLENIDQLATVIWQINPVNEKTVLEAFQEYVPRSAKQFADPATTLFKIRPDFKVYVTCAAQGASDASLAMAKQNAEDNPDVGAYWWQYARFLEELGQPKAAIEALERCRNCPVFPAQQDALARLAELYYAGESWALLQPVVDQQLLVSVLPTPRMHLMYAEAVRSTDEHAAKTNVRQGLALPGRGFEKDVVRLRELAKELGL